MGRHRLVASEDREKWWAVMKMVINDALGSVKFG
jgi:hypothetical protein